MARPRIPVERWEGFWSGVRSGLSLRDAAQAVDLPRESARKEFLRQGGVMPRRCVPSGVRLSFVEREEIALLRAQGVGVRQIARRLDRSPSTISRELARGRTNVDGCYRASTAQQRADQDARRPKAAKLATNLPLRREVQRRLRLKHSPEQISQRLQMDFPDDLEMRVSPETIYQAIYVQGRGALRKELAQCLRTGRAVRKPRRVAGERRGRIPNMVNIAERPPEVADRAVPGHWEGDLIVGEHNASAVGTLVERTTGFLLLLHLPGDHRAATVQDAIVAKTTELPAMLRRTLTWDQGIEMANHVQIAEATGLDIYFCDPHSPWQRGSNENTNGLIRQYLPKGSDLSFYGPGLLDNIADEINTRPRKRLSWRTPAEALADLLLTDNQEPGVAPTG